MSSGDERDGFGEGTSRSEGDPRVLLVLNAVLSSAFAWLLVWGLSLLDTVEYTAVNVATLAILLIAATYLVTQR